MDRWTGPGNSCSGPSFSPSRGVAVSFRSGRLKSASIESQDSAKKEEGRTMHGGNTKSEEGRLLSLSLSLFFLRETNVGRSSAKSHKSALPLLQSQSLSLPVAVVALGAVSRSHCPLPPLLLPPRWRTRPACSSLGRSVSVCASEAGMILTCSSGSECGSDGNVHCVGMINNMVRWCSSPNLLLQ